ncbi:MAG: nucleotidyltransferase domain-containing protein [Deltaproteobacteria bacterium]|nr:nucleotidyltransferase domain-containing protein [Deltaproteobacteria bacterium]
MKPTDLNNCLKQMGARLKAAYHAQQVILFGSRATQSAKEDSDVDLFVIAPTKEKFFQRMATVKRLLREVRQGLPVAPIVLTPEELRERTRAGDSFVKGVMAHGLRL